MSIADRFDSRTFANMEVALERACQLLPKDSDSHDVRRRIAIRIIQCAEAGDRRLGGLTEAGRAEAKELAARRAA